ncbi:hypothetical protein CAEBREN_07781 [Caenorhabditis brenneri]|uniref:Uncharacterized protein n=1 Tax=Caenorhabditis brenneri TaxID=135651 RepID=G0NME2_CAEBE|nr:hypothetical protein CAEBREN_07781 [Caenorhabditis brenneri]
MSDISRWLEIVDQLYTKDITGLINTVRCAFSETSITEESCDSSWFEVATTSKNLPVLRTAKMMDQPPGGNSENPTVPPEAAPAEGNTDNSTGSPRVQRNPSIFTRFAGFMGCLVRSQRRVHNAGAADQQRANTSPTTDTAPSGSNPTTNPTSNTVPPVKQFIPKPGTRRSYIPDIPEGFFTRPNERTDGQGTSGTNQESSVNWDEPIHIPSEHGTTDDEASNDLPNSSAESKKDEPSTAPFKPKSILKNGGSNTGYKNGNGKASNGGSFGVRDANSLYLPDQNRESNGTSTPHHSELFGSFNLEHLTEVDSGDWLDYFREEYSEHSSFWY